MSEPDVPVPVFTPGSFGAVVPKPGPVRLAICEQGNHIQMRDRTIGPRSPRKDCSGLACQVYLLFKCT